MNAEIAETSASVETQSRAVPAYCWYVLFMLTSAYTLHSVDRAVLSIVMEPVRTEYNLSDSELGFIAGLAIGIPYALAGIPVGVILDRVNRRNFLAGALSLWSLLTLLGGYAQTYTQLLITRLAVGGALSATPATHAMLTDYFPAERRPMALGVLVSGGTMAYILLFAIGGWVAQGWGWRAVLIVAGIPGLIIALLLLLTVREPPRGATERAATVAEPPPSLGYTLGYLIRLRSFRHLYVGYVFSTATIATFWAWIGSLLIRVHGLPVKEAGLYLAGAGGLFAFIGAFGGAFVAGHIGRRGINAIMTFIAVSAVLAAPFAIAMALVPWLSVTLVCMAIAAALKCCYVGPLQGLFLSIAKVRMRGVTAALLNVSGSLVGIGIGPLIAGMISDAAGHGTAIRYGLAACFLFEAWAGIHYWIAKRYYENDLASVSK
jgi:predicted MFS family arabinose efflux permease